MSYFPIVRLSTVRLCVKIHPVNRSITAIFSARTVHLRKITFFEHSSQENDTINIVTSGGMLSKKASKIF